MATVTLIPRKPVNDPGTPFVVTVTRGDETLFRIGGGPNALVPFDPNEYDQAVDALKAALRFIDDEAL